MDLSNIVTLLFGSGVLVGIVKYIFSKMKVVEKDSLTMRYGIQALLRDRLYALYYKYEEKGYAPTYAKENFNNMYNQYHSLGANGVMDKYYVTFMNLPDREKETENED